jgi:F0F1-type ATP synthase membrane subunit b/b'
MNSDINKKSAREIRHEVMGDIKKLNHDIDRIKDHLTPGQIIDDAIYYRHAKTPRATFDYLKENPVGTSFLALGTLLLMEDETNRSFETITKNKASGAFGSAKESAYEIRDGLKTRIDDVKLKVDDVKSNIKSKISKEKEEIVEASASEYEQAKEKSLQGIESAKSKAKSLKGQVQDLKKEAQDKIPDIKDQASKSFDSAKEKIASASESVKKKVSEGLDTAKSKANSIEPLTYAVLGAGLGTLTGASLPLSEKEEKFAEGKMDEKISDFTRDLQDALNESANILKSEFLNDISGIDLNIFRRDSNESKSA